MATESQTSEQSQVSPVTRRYLFGEVSESPAQYRMHFPGSKPCCKPTRLARLGSEGYRIVAVLPTGARMSVPIGRVPLNLRLRSA
jgi:hypothetical protein